MMSERSLDMMVVDRPENHKKVIAVVSGKGGSGKTMLAVALAQGAALAGKDVVLVDTDFATGGLTYYLTFREFRNVREGLSDVIEGNSIRKPLYEWAAVGTPDDSERNWLRQVRLVSIGDQRRLRSNLEADLTGSLQNILAEATQISDLVIVDCRGGIDGQSLEVCGLVDEIVIVVETDTTSIRASQHLAEILSDQKLKNKVAGFVLNKVMDDPTALAKAASSLLSAAYLGSIPFDIEATRAYIQGRVPSPSTLFARHVFAILPRLVSDVSRYDKIRSLSPEEFGSVTLRSPEVRLGGLSIFGLTLYVSTFYIWLKYSSGGYDVFGSSWLSHSIDVIGTVMTNVLVLAALSDPIKQSLGRAIRIYAEVFGRIVNVISGKNKI